LRIENYDQLMAHEIFERIYAAQRDLEEVAGEDCRGFVDEEINALALTDEIREQLRSTLNPFNMYPIRTLARFEKRMGNEPAKQAAASRLKKAFEAMADEATNDFFRIITRHGKPHETLPKLSLHELQNAQGALQAIAWAHNAPLTEERIADPILAGLFPNEPYGDRPLFDPSVPDEARITWMHLESLVSTMQIAIIELIKEGGAQQPLEEWTEGGGI
jgi:hypothetical protein